MTHENLYGVKRLSMYIQDTASRKIIYHTTDSQQNRLADPVAILEMIRGATHPYTVMLCIDPALPIK